MEANKNKNLPNAPKGKDEAKKDPSASVKRMSYYGTQLAEKQKAKEVYGMREKQFRRFYEMARKKKGDTGANLIELLERRLDNVIFRAGWAATRRMARQMLVHKHFKVNGRSTDVPSFLVKVGDEITFRIDKMPKVLVNMEFTKGKMSLPKWVEKTKDSVKVTALPTRNEIDATIKESLIVELYSK